MKNTGKRIITTLLAIMMTITVLLGNGIEARAAEYFVADDIRGHEVKIGDIINASWTAGYTLRFYDGNDPNLMIMINVGSGQTHTLQASYSDGNGKTVGSTDCMKHISGPLILIQRRRCRMRWYVSLHMIPPWRIVI